MLLPALNKARERSRTIKCVSNRKQLATIFGMYFEQCDDYAPLARWGSAGTNQRWYRSIYDAGLYKEVRVDQYLGCPSKPNPATTPTSGESLAYNWRLGEEGVNYPKIIKARQPSKNFCHRRLQQRYYMHNGNYRVSKINNPVIALASAFYPWHNGEQSGSMLYLDGHVDQLFYGKSRHPGPSGWWI